MKTGLKIEIKNAVENNNNYNHKIINYTKGSK